MCNAQACAGKIVPGNRWRKRLIVSVRAIRIVWFWHRCLYQTWCIRTWGITHTRVTYRRSDSDLYHKSSVNRKCMTPVQLKESNRLLLDFLSEQRWYSHTLSTLYDLILSNCNLCSRGWQYITALSAVQLGRRVVHFRADRILATSELVGRPCFRITISHVQLRSVCLYT